LAEDVLVCARADIAVAANSKNDATHRKRRVAMPVIREFPGLPMKEATIKTQFLTRVAPIQYSGGVIRSKRCVY
jgi:hypothetical protein